MVRLDESADDARLDTGQRLEEKLESVDYDVWVCPTCQQSLVIPHRAWFSRYSTCKSCNRRTLETQTRTLVSRDDEPFRHAGGHGAMSATARGLGRTRERFREVDPSSGGSGSSGGGGGGGSSFGGGSSGGGGAGGHY